MAQHISIPLKDSYKLFNHGPVSIITSAHGDKRNIMAASWTMPLDFSPAKVAVVIDKNTYTRELVDASGEFALQFPMRRIAKLTLDVGDISGRELDKFTAFNIKTFPAAEITAPLIEDCIGWLECKVVKQSAESMDLIVGEVVAAYADAEQFLQGRWNFSDDPQKRSIHYMAGGEFYSTGESFTVTQD